MLNRVYSVIEHLSLSIFGKTFNLIAEHDKIHENGRIYLQITYTAPCTKTGRNEIWNGRKWYLSEFMTNDEIVKTAYCAFKACVEHEVMEGFKYDDIIVFNPHIDFMELIAISHKEIKREPK